MPEPERLDVLILGSGQGGKLLAWHMARSGRRTAVVERRMSAAPARTSPACPARTRSGARGSRTWHARSQFGTMTGTVTIDMAKVRQRKRDMVDREVAAHLENYKTSGAELIMGTGRFVAPKTLEVESECTAGRAG